MNTVSLKGKGKAWVIGRNPVAMPEASQWGEPLQLQDERLSQCHLRIHWQEEAFWATDLDSTNGTYHMVTKERLGSRQPLKLSQSEPTALLAGGHLVMVDPHQGTVDCIKLTEAAVLEVKGVTVSRPNSPTPILKDVSFMAWPGRVMGIMGGSGTGKSTLLKAINGYEPPTAGQILLNDQPLYGFPELRQWIGYLPQEDIFHTSLTIREALGFTAEMRLPGVPASFRRERIEQVIRDLGLREASDNQVLIQNLSGGQKKRVGIAMELLGDPKILFLDEPTSGLSSEDSYSLLLMLRRLAETTRKTILMVIHQPSLDTYLQLHDLVVLKKDAAGTTPGGNSAQVIYSGPADVALEHFAAGIEVHTLEERFAGKVTADVVLLATDGDPKSGSKRWTVAQWMSLWRQTPYWKAAQGAPVSMGVAALKPLRPFGPGQLFSLLRRTLLVKVRDRRALGMALIQPLIIGIALTQALGSLEGTSGPHLWNQHFFLMISALWCGASSTPNDIVGEWRIFHRERMVNLKLPSYLFSKVIVLGLFAGVQALLVLLPVWMGSGLKIGIPVALGILWLTVVAGNALGLLLSATAQSSEAAVSLVPLPLVVMLLFAGGSLRRLPDMRTSDLTISQVLPSRYSFEALVLKESEAWGDQGRDWHKAFFDLKQKAGELPEETHRASTFPNLLGSLLAWIGAVWAGILGVLWRRVS